MITESPQFFLAVGEAIASKPYSTPTAVRNKIFIMILKKVIVLIVVLYPIRLVAQRPEKNRTVNNITIGTYTYEEDEERLLKNSKPVIDQRLFILKLIRKKDHELLLLTDSTAQNIAQQAIDSLNKVFDQLDTELFKIQFNFIRNNTASLFSLERLKLLLTQNGDPSPLRDTIEFLFKNLDKSIKNSKSGKDFSRIMMNMKKSEVGAVAPNFTVNDINNNLISLSSFRDKRYIILDFWASWCVPCREDIPFLKDIYKEYHQKGLDIIAISKDDDLSLWKKAIKQDNTQMWKHVSVPFKDQRVDSVITNKYAVYGIPVKILINKKGVIIGRWSGSGDKNMAELKKLLNNEIGN